MTANVREFFAAVGHNLPLLKPDEYGVQIAPTSLHLLKIFDTWENRNTRQIVFEGISPYPTIIIHVTYEDEIPTEQEAIRQTVKALVGDLLQDEALSAAARALKVDTAMPEPVA
jgi:hypothetical protein